MRYATAAAFRAALEHRLLTASRERDAQLAWLRKLVVFDRFLARLLAVAPDRWVVKGGVALEFRLGDRARTTRDLDLARQDTEEEAASDLAAVESIDLGDFFAFAVRRTTRLDAALAGVAVRYRVAAELDGRRFEEVTVDVGFGSSLVASVDLLRGPDLLAFAGFDPITIPALPLTQHVAEKLHAYTRTYQGQQASTRVKDLIDLVLIQAAATFEAGTLRCAVQITFSERDVQSLPVELPVPPSSWRATYPALAVEVGLDPDVSVGHRLAAAFLDPVLSGITPDEAHWDPEAGSWLPPAR
jgi:hypothetical protein